MAHKIRMNEMYKHVSLINISNKELSFKVIYLSFLKQ